MTTFLAATYLFLRALAEANPSSDTTVRYAYDDSGRLTEVRYGNGITVRYAYDAQGRRTLRETSK
ncbi:hypothetical protein F183_A30790 [Bryobacterales bacterium F-183]|nr:hypothetical protein F183_A30790 [Bryobacterales bacterium F-183]